MKSWKSLLSAAGIAMLFVGCSQQTEDAAPVPETPPSPVTLKIYQNGSYLTEDDLNELVVNPVKRKYPHITVESVVSSKNLNTLIAEGEEVDFYITWNGAMGAYKDLGYFQDITPLAKKHNFDLGRFDQNALEALKVVSDGGQELYALPYAVNLNALYYNKTIFDQFATPYPLDGMTWSEATDVARKVTRMEGSTQYRGLDTDNYLRFTFPLSLAVVDARTHKPLVNSEPYKKAFETAKQIYAIPGNDYQEKGGLDRFLKEKTTAMMATVNLFSRLKSVTDLEWDLAQFPSYPDKRNVYGMYDLHIMIPNANRPHQDDMMRVMEVFFSEEVQTAMVEKTARVSALKDPKYKQQLGKQVPELQGKRLASVFKSVPAPAPEYSIYFSKSDSLLRAKFTRVMQNAMDINTALREADEEISSYISTQLNR